MRTRLIFAETVTYTFAHTCVPVATYIRISCLTTPIFINRKEDVNFIVAVMTVLVKRSTTEDGLCNCKLAACHMYVCIYVCDQA